jgi:hypothetical protein
MQEEARRAVLLAVGALATVAFGAFPGAGSVAVAQASPDMPARAYFGTPGGWSFRGSAESASASTLLLGRDESGVLLIFCEGKRSGFHLSLSTTDRRSLGGAEDGLLQVYPAQEASPDAPLAQFRVRFFSRHELRSMPLLQPGWDHPDRLVEVIQSHTEGLRLVVAQVPQHAFGPLRVAEIYLPEGTDGSGLPMDTALAFLARDCRSGLKSQDADAG